MSTKSKVQVTEDVGAAQELSVLSSEQLDNVENEEFYTEIVDVTPRLASYWLSHNAERNRREKTTRVRKYARDMAEGYWMLTGDTVKVTKDGVMIDGGQRMRAVVRAGREYPGFVSVRMVFARNVPYEAILVTDTGGARTFADALKIEDAVNQNQCGAIVRRAHVWMQGNPTFTRGSNNATFIDPTMSELLDLYREDRLKFDAAALRGVDFRTARIGNTTAAGTSYYMLERIDHDRAMDFYDAVISGKHERDDDPTWVLRERLRRAHQRMDRGDVLNVTEQMYFIVRTWNAWLQGEKLERLTLPRNREVTNARFPRPLYPNEV